MDLPQQITGRQDACRAQYTLVPAFAGMTGKGGNDREGRDRRNHETTTGLVHGGNWGILGGQPPV